MADRCEWRTAKFTDATASGNVRHRHDLHARRVSSSLIAAAAPHMKRKLGAGLAARLLLRC